MEEEKVVGRNRVKNGERDNEEKDVKKKKKAKDSER